MDPINTKKIEQNTQQAPEVPVASDFNKYKESKEYAPILEQEKKAEIEASTKEKIEIKDESFLDDTIDSLKNKLKKTKRRPAPIPQVRDQLTLKIENIMESGLEDAYREMTAVQQQEFKIKGERTALEIRQLLRTGKIKIKKIFQLLLEWLRVLPGVNKFFLEQEAKIKADKIIALKKLDDKL